MRAPLSDVSPALKVGHSVILQPPDFGPPHAIRVSGFGLRVCVQCVRGGCGSLGMGAHALIAQGT